MSDLSRPVHCKNPTPLLRIFVLLPSFLMVLVSAPDMAAEPSGHGAHVHGLGGLNIALDGNLLYLELNSPAANIIGFEHTPQNEREKETVSRAIQKLEGGAELFVPNPKAGCGLQESRVHHSLELEPEDSGKHGSFPHRAADTHAEDGHRDGKDGDHEEELHDEHSDIEATYSFSCSRPDMLEEIDVRLFETFPGFEKIQLQLLTPDGQKGATLTPRDHRISF